MRAIVVAAVLVGLAVLAAVIVLGRSVVEPEPLDPSLVRVDHLSWAERANAHCRDATAAVVAALSGPVGLEPEEERAVRIYRETTQIQGRLVRQLREIDPATTEQKGTVAVLAGQQGRDARTAAALEERFDAELIRTELERYDVIAEGLRTRFRRLGAGDCVAYLDPASYG